jgi:hypothetical protein
MAEKILKANNNATKASDGDCTVEELKEDGFTYPTKAELAEKQVKKDKELLRAMEDQ